MICCMRLRCIYTPGLPLTHIMWYCCAGRPLGCMYTSITGHLDCIFFLLHKRGFAFEKGGRKKTRKDPIGACMHPTATRHTHTQSLVSFSCFKSPPSSSLSFFPPSFFLSSFLLRSRESRRLLTPFRFFSRLPPSWRFPLLRRRLLREEEDRLQLAVPRRLLRWKVPT